MLKNNYTQIYSTLVNMTKQNEHLADLDSLLYHDAKVLTSYNVPKNDNGLYSATLLLDSLPEELKYMVAMLHEVTALGAVFKARKNPECNMFIPLVMSFFKKHKGIAYESWDKEDNVHLLMSHRLFNDITSSNIISDIDLARAYHCGNATDIPKKPFSLAQYSNYSVGIAATNNGKALSSYSVTRHIELQTWWCNVSNRTELMILDKDNWDNMPDAIDAISAIAPKEPITPISIKTKLPW